MILLGWPTGPNLNDPEKLRDLKLGKQYENVDWYRLWVWDSNDMGPRPRPNRPCAGKELPVAFCMQPKLKPGTASAARVMMSCERFAAREEPP